MHPFDVDGLIRAAVQLRESGIREGLCLVNAMHITASVFINDDEPGLHRDYEAWLERLAPHAPTAQYRHNDTGEDNADARLTPRGASKTTCANRAPAIRSCCSGMANQSPLRDTLD